MNPTVPRAPMQTPEVEPIPEAITLAIEVSNPSIDRWPQVSADVADESRHAGARGDDVIGPSVALARGGAILDQEALSTPDSRHDDDLMPAIDRLVRRVGLSPRDIARVAVSIGPGGFTGLRVSIATAKAIGEAIIARGGERACCIGVPTALVAARALADAGRWPADTRGGAHPIAVALASKRDTAFVTVFDTASGPNRAGGIADAAELERLHGVHRFRLLLADRFLPGAMREAAARLGIACRPPGLSAASCARAGGGLRAMDPAALAPLYPREPEAVTKWRTLHGR